jgi:oxaloacetate decarboxylase (Na+ extruding) subunit alpha
MNSKKNVETSGKKKIGFIDTTLRDGTQSIWAMKLGYGVVDAVAGEIDKAGYDFIDIPCHAVYCKLSIRFFKEDPWPTMELFREKFKNSKTLMPIHNRIDMLGDGESRSMVRLWHALMINTVKPHVLYSQANSRDECDRYYPWLVPMIREFGLPFMPLICYYPCPRATDEYYANLLKKVMTYKPEYIWLKDAGGLFTVERIKTLLPALQKVANGTPIHLHTHGMSTNQGRVVVEAMKMGIDGVHTCIPPLASGSSHVSIYNAMHNAHVLGIEHKMTDVAALEEAERRLRIIGKVDGLPEGIPMEYEEDLYTHQLPGGVISNLKEQLRQLHIPEKLDEVLEEVKQIIVDLGYPMMITPFSQFIVAQAVVNISTGKRYEVILDPIIEMAIGVHGIEDIGIPYMDPNVKDMILNSPNVKLIRGRYEKQLEIEEQEGSVEMIRQSYGMTHASDRDFMYYHFMKGDKEIKEVQPPVTYYTGKEPLSLLLKELSKHHDVSRLTMQKGSSFFEFRQQ